MGFVVFGIAVLYCIVIGINADYKPLKGFWYALATAFSIVVGISIWLAPPVTTRLDFSYNIYALEDVQQTQSRGHRYYFEQDFKYYHLADYKDGKKMYAVNRSQSYIVEKDGVQPHIEVYTEGRNSDNPLLNFMFLSVQAEGLDKEYKIVVPTGSESKSFNVDMK